MIPAFVGKRPETPGVNMLVDGSAKRACMYWMGTWSDIIAHLTFLFQNAKGNVLELGTRGGVSTAALLAGVEKNGGHLFSVDIDDKCGETFKGHPQWTFALGSSLGGPGTAPYQLLAFQYDLIFIDTDHTYEQLSAELARWAPRVKPGGLIAMHDMESFPEMAKAAYDYAAEHSPRQFLVLSGSNGLGVMYI